MIVCEYFESSLKGGRDDSDFPRAPNWKDFKSAKHYDSGENAET